jgi:hypothetical protein
MADSPTYAEAITQALGGKAEGEGFFNALANGVVAGLKEDPRTEIAFANALPSNHVQKLARGLEQLLNVPLANGEETPKPNANVVDSIKRWHETALSHLTDQQRGPAKKAASEIATSTLCGLVRTTYTELQALSPKAVNDVLSLTAQGIEAAIDSGKSFSKGAEPVI